MKTIYWSVKPVNVYFLIENPSQKCLFFSTDTNGLVVSLGRENQQTDENPNEKSYTVSGIINHPDYDSNTNDNDISLLQLSTEVEFNDFIRPVCLAANGSEFPAGTECWVTGWGTMDVDGEESWVYYRLVYLQTNHMWNNGTNSVAAKIFNQNKNHFVK